MKTTLDIAGMHCPACARRLSEAFRAVPGVTDARVSLEPPRAEIESDAPIDAGALVSAAASAGAYTVRPVGGEAPSQPGPPLADAPKPASSLYPLFLIVGFIVGVTALTTFVRAGGSLHAWMYDFMAGFFLVFSFFKLLDLRGFADAYQTYDIVAQRSRAWALAYPFVELALGVGYLVRWQTTALNAATLVLMLVGSIGVLRAILRKDRIRCACLGTALNLPMTTVTLVEDLGMAAMAAVMLVWGM